MRALSAVVVLGAVAALPAAAQTTQRQLGPHEHGRGTLNIVVEGNIINMELQVSGMDIVGFEHAAKTHKDKATLEMAKQKLSAPLSLFNLPASAGCRVTEAKVELASGDSDHPADAGEKGEASRSSQAEQNPGAEKLEFNVITPKGQNKFEVTRARPNISLVGTI